MNIWKIIYLNCGQIYEFMVDHRSYKHNLSKLKPENNSGLNGILCGTGAVLYRLDVATLKGVAEMTYTRWYQENKTEKDRNLCITSVGIVSINFQITEKRLSEIWVKFSFCIIHMYFSNYILQEIMIISLYENDSLCNLVPRVSLRRGTLGTGLES